MIEAPLRKPITSTGRSRVFQCLYLLQVTALPESTTNDKRNWLTEKPHMFLQYSYLKIKKSPRFNSIFCLIANLSQENQITSEEFFLFQT